MATVTMSRPPRRHDLDALRVLAFGVLILYHLGMAYVPDWGWHVKSQYPSEWLQLPMMVVNRWRMPLLFLLSGLAIGLYDPSRHPWRFMRDRTLRLLLPLGFAMVATIPVQAYCQGVFNGKVAPGFLSFLADYFAFRPWPEGAFDGSDIGITWNHLWYLPYLWTYTVVLALAVPLLESAPGRRAMARVAGAGWPALLLLVAGVAFGAMCLLADAWPPANNLFADWYQHAVFFPVFLLGFVLARGGHDPATLVRARGRLLAVASSLALVYLPLAFSADVPTGSALQVALRALRALYMAAALLAILAWGRHLLARPTRWLPAASEAVFPWYILHQTLIVWLVFVLSPMALGPVLEPMAVLAGTVGGCWLLHGGLIERFAWLRPVFGLKPRAASHGRKIAATASVVR